MKQRNLKKKAESLLLVAAMLITSFLASGTEVHATEASLAVPGRFVTTEQLTVFNTDDKDEAGANPAKVYFGKNGQECQEWWIVGSQKPDSVILFAASPLATGIMFDPQCETDEESQTVMKPYPADGDCTYPDGTDIESVFVNHYGASSLRGLLKELETSNFSTVEQALMQGTTVYTKDNKSKKVYSTTDKLYLAYGSGTSHVTVGTNSSDELSSGLSIDKAYWGSNTFWLRNPKEPIWVDSVDVEVVDRGKSVGANIYYMENAVVPAFELDLSSVLFVSAVKAASSEREESGTIADDAVMTLRLDGSGEKIGTIGYDVKAGKIVAQKDADAAGTVSLVVQGKGETGDWYYSVQAGETTIVTKEQIETACDISGIDFTACKIWLETPVENGSVAYAKMADAKNLNEAATLEPGQTVVRADETISNGQDGTVTVDKGHDGTVDVTVRLPEAGNVSIAEDGKITVPAGGKVQVADGKELILPNGGTVNTDGNIEAEKIISGDITVTAPAGEKVTADKVGKITVPAGEKVQVAGGKELMLPNGGTVDTDGNIEAEKIISGDITVTASEGGKVTVDKEGNITIPAGGKVETGDGKEQILQYGGTVDKDGKVQVIDENGNIIIPAGGTVETEDGKELTLPNGGTVDADGNVEAEKIISGDITVAAPEGGKVTADKEGKITVPAGGTVQIADGKELTLPNGGTVDIDGNIEAEKIISGDITVTAPEGGKVTADKEGNITVPAGGKVETGDGKVRILPYGGTVDKDGNITEPPFEGMGTAENPYLIKTEKDLKKLAELVNSGEVKEGAHYKIEAEITLTQESSLWTPIGTADHPFTGTFDGDGKTIKGLKISIGEPKDNQGLFGVNAGTIENLIVEGSVTGKDNVGGIAGTNTETGIIKGCTLNVSVTGQNNVGSIAGKNDGTVTGCTNIGSVTGSSPTPGGDKPGTMPGGDKPGTTPGGDKPGTTPEGDKPGTTPGGDILSDLTPEQKEKVNQIAKELNVPVETAKKVQEMAQEFGIETDTLLLTDKDIVNQKSEGDVKGADFSKLQAKAAKVKKNSITVKWNKVKGAGGYQIYAAKCGKNNKYKLVKTIEKAGTTSFTYKRLKKGTAYKIIVKAYKDIDGKKYTVAASKTVHEVTEGGKKTNAKSVKVNKSNVKLKKGKKFKVKAKIVKVSFRKKLLNHRKLSYESTNKKIATVSKKGVISGKKKGTCYVYVYAENGIFKKVKVTVK